LPKLKVIREALHLRRRRPELFGADEAAAYSPLQFSGAKAEHAVGFTRGGSVAVVTPRLVLGLGLHLCDPWGDTTVALPPGLWIDLVTGHPWHGGQVAVGELLASFPVALLERDPAI